jgi:hypothetical protein
VRALRNCRAIVVRWLDRERLDGKTHPSCRGMQRARSTFWSVPKVCRKNFSATTLPVSPWKWSFNNAMSCRALLIFVRMSFSEVDLAWPDYPNDAVGWHREAGRRAVVQQLAPSQLPQNAPDVAGVILDAVRLCRVVRKILHVRVQVNPEAKQTTN